MKTSTLLLLGGAAAAVYFLAKRSTAGTVTPGIMSQASLAAPAPQVVVNVETPEYADYSVPGWGWAQPVYGARSWRGGGGHHHGHGGHGGGHGHRGRR